MPEIIPKLLLLRAQIALVIMFAAFHINHQRSRARGYA
jgi:hypothetical protein